MRICSLKGLLNLVEIKSPLKISRKLLFIRLRGLAVSQQLQQMNYGRRTMSTKEGKGLKLQNNRIVFKCDGDFYVLEIAEALFETGRGNAFSIKGKLNS